MRAPAALWPKSLPRTLDVPATTLGFNLQVSAARYPQKAAYDFFGRALSYAQLLSDAEALAGWLHAQGVRAGDRVLLDMQNCPQFVTAYYGILRANAVVVPVNPMSTAPELAHYLQDSGARVIICAADAAPHVAALARQGPVAQAPRVLVTYYADALPKDAAALDGIPPHFRPWLLGEAALEEGWTRWTEALAQRLPPPAESAAPDDMAMLAYTSGTTGKPKGCIHTHATLMPNAVGVGLWQQMTAESRSLTVAPMFHITGLVAGVLSSVHLGATAFILPRWDRELAGRWITQHRLTHFACIPTMLVDLLASPNLGQFDLGSLHNLCGGGSAMPQAVAERLQQQFGVTFIEGYGLTETSAMTHMNPLSRPKWQCIGIPTFGNDARIVEPESLQALAAGQAGEILIHGPTLFKGYWQHPEATSEAFVEIDGKRFLRTGDIGHVDEDGYFFLTDRLKRMINASGFKVWPAEVEARLFAHPQVQDACVVAARDAYRGETVKAYVVPRREAKDGFSADELMAWAREQMAAYKVPRIVEVVDSLPKSASGKVLWRVLQDAQG